MHHNRRRRDSACIALIFPADLRIEQVQAWLQAVWGTLRMGSVPLALEVLQTDRGVQHFLRLPREHAGYVVDQLRALVPNVHAEQVEPDYTGGWMVVAELGEMNTARALRVGKPEPTAASLLASMGGLRPGERLLMQWVISPAAAEKMPVFHKPPHVSGIGMNLLMTALATPKEEVEERRAKLAQPNFDAVLRLAATAETRVRATHLMQRPETALASVSGNGNGFSRLPVQDVRALHHRVRLAMGMHQYPAKLTATDLSALMAWPVGSPNIAGLARGRTRHLPATEAVPRVGALIGRSTFPGNERPIALSPRYRAQHLDIMGSTGSGKTTLMANLAAYDMEAGHGVVIIDPKGDLIEATIDRTPFWRLNDVILMTLQDTNFPVGYNLLRDGSRERAVSQVIRVLEARWPDMRRGVWAPAGFFRGLTALSQWPGGAFPDIVPLLSPTWASESEAAWREAVLRSVKDENAAAFWQRYLKERPTQQDNYAAPVIDRAWIFNERPALRNIIGQSRSTFDMADVAAGRKLLFVNLAGDVDEEAAKLLGSLLLNSFWNAARNRSDRSTPTFVYIDEFADFMHLPVGFEEMLAKLRSTNTGMVLAHQDLGQIRKRPDLMSTLMANTKNKVMFTMSKDDARVMAGELGGRVSDHDLQYLGRFEVIARLMTDQGLSDPLTARTFDYVPSLRSADAVRARSRLNYGRPVEQVEAEIRTRRRVQPANPKRRPTIGEEEWK